MSSKNERATKIQTQRNEDARWLLRISSAPQGSNERKQLVKRVNKMLKARTR